MDTPGQKYQYMPLPDADSIRVLQLYPRLSSDAVISGTLILRRLYEREPQYTSLSYSWGRNSDGDASLSRTVLIDGYEFPIAENLHDFLLLVTGGSSTAETPPLWIDALCIDQEDVQERSKQVAIMASIYQNASDLIIWLGHGTNDSEDREAMDALELIPRVQDWLISKSVDIPEQIMIYGQNGLCMPEYQAIIARFCQRRYFHRRWAIQEIHNSKPDRTLLIWGMYQMDAREFSTRLRGVKYLVEQESIDGSWSGSTSKPEVNEDSAVLRKVYNLMTLQESYDPSKRFRASLRVLDCLFAFQDTVCTDDRDRVYSLLSFAGDRNHMSHSADYSLGTTDTYVAFASSVVQEGWVETLLNLASWQVENGHRCEGDGENTLFPSWCPDFRCDIREGQSSHLKRDKHKKAARGYSSYNTPRPRVLIEERMLKLRVKIGRLLPEEMRDATLKQELDGLLEDDYLCQLTKQNIDSRFVLRPIADRPKSFVLLGSWKSTITSDSPDLWKNCRDVTIQTITMI